MDQDTSTGALIVILVIAFLVFLICRELVCWYWKINRQVELLEQILTELKNGNRKIGLE